MNKRDRVLLEKVGSFYLQYKGIVDLNGLLSTLNGTEELPIDNYTISYIYYYIMYLITKSVVRSAKEAKKSRLTFREFATDYSEEAYGQLNVDMTIHVYPMGMVAYHTFAEGYNAPEYAILGYILRRIYEIIKEKRDQIRIGQEQVSPYFSFF
ncbi:hypothetical protein [Metallosphaera hakonensis]|nr:hypothetical protein [Metallosphaera hakonensis]